MKTSNPTDPSIG